MGDSLFYTDDMLEEMDKHDSSLYDEDKISSFLNECNKINEKINALSTGLNEDSVEKLNINEQLKEIVRIIKLQTESYEAIAVSEEEKTKVNEVMDELKENFVALLNKHVNRYNTKVDYINTRINEWVTVLRDFEISTEVEEMINALEMVQRCEEFNNGDWRHIKYISDLDYEKLEKEISKISRIEKVWKIKPIESVEVWASCNHIKLTIAELKEEIKEELSLVEINLLLRECRVCYEQILDADIRHQLSINESSNKKITSSYNSKITKFINDINKIQLELLEKKKNVSKKTSSYKVYSYELDLLEKRYTVIARKIIEYRGKCNDRVIKRLNTSYLKKYEKQLIELQEKIELDKDNLDIIQYRNLTKRVKKIKRKHDSINFDLNISPIMLNGVDVGKDFENKMKDFDSKLDELQGKIKDLGEDKLRFIKDHGVRKEIDQIINARWSEIYAYEKLLSSYKKESREVYNVLKGKLDEKKIKFDKVCKEYRGKCPLGVKQVKSAKHLYKKHRKAALVIAGLSTMVLLLGSSVIIPSIMHGNIMIAAKSPAMRPFIKNVNNVLGGMIGATKDINGAWFLSNGLMVNPSVASTSLLKGLAISGLGQTALLSPLIAGVVVGVKNLVGKMKSGELKKKMQESKEKKAIKKVERIENKNTRHVDKSLMNELKELFKAYRSSGMSLDEFASVNGLSNKQVVLLEYLEEQIADMKNSRNSSRKGGR